MLINRFSHLYVYKYTRIRCEVVPERNESLAIFSFIFCRHILATVSRTRFVDSYLFYVRSSWKVCRVLVNIICTYVEYWNNLCIGPEEGWWCARLFRGASLVEGSTIHPICELPSTGALPFYMTLARYTETSVQCEESGRCVTSRGAGCRRACMTSHTPSNTARRRSKFSGNRHRKLLPLRQT